MAAGLPLPLPLQLLLLTSRLLLIDAQINFEASPSTSDNNDSKSWLFSTSNSSSSIGKTRFFNGPIGVGGPPAGVFGNPCDRCSTYDQQCCHTRRLCCQYTHNNPFLGQPGYPSGPSYPPGQIAYPQGHYQGQGPYGYGFKPGVCPAYPALASGYPKFGGAPCVRECEVDFNCPTIMKCCPIGCSYACRNPEGTPLVIPPSKPGRCPSGFLGFRSGANEEKLDARTDAPSAITHQQKRKGKRSNQREEEHKVVERSTSDAYKPWSDRERRFASPNERETNLEGILGHVRSRRDAEMASTNMYTNHQDPDDEGIYLDHRKRFMESEDRYASRAEDDSGRDRRSPHHQEDRNDRREIRLNRRWRVSGRVIRSATEGTDIPSRGKGAEPSQRFFLSNPFCQSNCQNDYDCGSHFKCCAKDKNCLQCMPPY